MTPVAPGPCRLSCERPALAYPSATPATARHYQQRQYHKRLAGRL